MNKKLMNVLKDLNSISDKVIMKYPITTVVSSSCDMMANVYCEKLECESFEDIPLYELSKLISLLSLFDEYEIKKDNNSLLVTSRANSAVFTLAQQDLLEEYNKSSDIIERTDDKFETVAEFDLDVKEINKIKKASSIFDNLNTVVFESKDGNIEIKLDITNRFESSNNTYKLELFKCSEKNFKIPLDILNFIKLPNNTYKVRVKYNQERDSFRILFDGDVFKCIIAQLSN